MGTTRTLSARLYAGAGTVLLIAAITMFMITAFDLTLTQCASAQAPCNAGQNPELDGDTTTTGDFIVESSTGFGVTIQHSATAARTFDLPNASGTAAMIDVGQTFTVSQSFTGGIENSVIGAITPAAAEVTTLGVGITPLTELDVYGGAASNAIIRVSADDQFDGSFQFFRTTNTPTVLARIAYDESTVKLLIANDVGGASPAITLSLVSHPNALVISNSGKATFEVDPHLASGIDIIFDTDGTSDIGKTGERAANVWADLINGADYGYDNGWRMLEAETYEGYGPGIAIDHGDYFVPGEALAVKHVNNGRTKLVEVGVDNTGQPIFEERIALDRTRITNVQQVPVFAITDEFIEFHGIRITLDDWIALAALAAQN